MDRGHNKSMKTNRRLNFAPVAKQDLKRATHPQYWLSATLAYFSRSACAAGCCWGHSKWCSVAKSVANFVLIFSFAAGVVQRVLSQDQCEIDNTITAVLADWDALPTVFDDIDIYARQIRQLAEIGKPAVPALTAALDKTSRDTEMRLLAFTLRAIGDPRAVPALIRAIPKTLLPPGSDCGMSVSDRQVLKFMQSNDLDGSSEKPAAFRDNFSMGRPVREISTALQRITG